jgi:hypothetical protein
MMVEAKILVDYELGARVLAIDKIEILAETPW